MKRLEYNDVKNIIENKGYKLLSDKYINKNEKLLLECNHGHKFEMTFCNFKYNNQGCHVCWRIKEKHSYDFIKDYINSFNYKLISKTYINANTKLELQCNKGHIFKLKWNNIQQGQRCPMCSKTKHFSKPEKEILDYIKNIYNGTIIPNDRKTILNIISGRYLELDIWLPEIRKAIEYGAEYYHTNNHLKYRDNTKTIFRDYIKQNYCKENNIDLLIINEGEWKRNKDYKIIENFIME